MCTRVKSLPRTLPASPSTFSPPHHLFLSSDLPVSSWAPSNLASTLLLPGSERPSAEGKTKTVADGTGVCCNTHDECRNRHDEAGPVCRPGGELEALFSADLYTVH